MTRTAMITTGLIITIGIYDLIAINHGGLPLSVSKFLQNSALDAPFVSFTVGFVCGHIFGYMKPDDNKTRSTD